MGYYYTAEPENAVPPKSCASPKTHTPGSPVKERGHRYYMPEVGRWLSRDPMEEGGGFLLYGFCSNSSHNGMDALGKKKLDLRKTPIDVGMCGEYYAAGEFYFTLEDVGGWWMQHVEVTRTFTKEGNARTVYTGGDGFRVDCCCSNVNRTVKLRSFDEAEEVVHEQGVFPIKIVDQSSSDVKTYCSTATETLSKTAVFRKNVKLGKDGCPEGYHRSLGPPVDPVSVGHCVKNNINNDFGDDSDATIYGIKAKWDCCPKTGKTSAEWF